MGTQSHTNTHTHAHIQRFRSGMYHYIYCERCDMAFGVIPSAGFTLSVWFCFISYAHMTLLITMCSVVRRLYIKKR